jgi:signal recognition particle GTPase
MFKKLGNALTKLGKRTLDKDNMEKTLEELKITLIQHDVAVRAAEAML